MNEANEQRELEILQELVRLERLESGINNFKGFINSYLSHLTYLKTPAFHREMMGLIEKMIQNTTMGQDGAGKSNESDKRVNNEGERGDSTPPLPIGYNTIPPPHFSDKNPKSSTPDESSSSPLQGNEAKTQELSTGYPQGKALNRVLFIAPRGFGKSYICSVFLPLWLALYGKKKDIFIVSSTISLGKELLRKQLSKQLISRNQIN